MDYSEKDNGFVLDGTDRRLLNISEDVVVWPLDAIEHLIDKLGDTQSRLNSRDDGVKDWPRGALRNAEEASIQRDNALLNVIRTKVGEHITLDDSVYDALLQQNPGDL